MAWFTKDALDAELQYIIDNCASGGASAEVILIDTWTADGSDTWADVYTAHPTGNKLGTADIDETGTYWGAFSDVGSNRQVSFLGATGVAVATDAAPTDLFIAIVDVVNQVVLAVTQETTNQAINDTNPITFPQFYLQANQPTGV